MKKENSLNICSDVPGGRVTRSRAAAYRTANLAAPMMPLVLKPDKEKGNIKSKRAAIDENSHVDPQTNAAPCKRRAVLKDVSNTCRENLIKPCCGAVKMQSSINLHNRPNILKVKRCSNLKRSKLPPTESIGSTQTSDLVKNQKTKDMQKAKVLEKKEAAVPQEKHDHLLSVQRLEVVKGGENICKAALFEEPCSVDELTVITDSKNGSCSDLGYMDIDVDNANPQMCCAYASDIYINLRATELVRRPVGNFMETLQRDITQSMRGVLIDWLVEVAEEYKLVPDTLYLTVYIIDRFLSQNYIERQRLQLLGITCMLIASKYEEICAPRVEEFCFITDNTYDKAEVLKMESEVLNCLCFQLSVPTIKTFLRRFLRAAQASNKIPILALGYLANYLAELTLVEYSFVKFLPSMVAASAIFLARWTLDQSDHPWNKTLEHYTSFKAIDLKVTVFALQELQVNSKNSPLNAIREKYKQPKFESVAALASPQFPQSLFC